MCSAVPPPGFVYVYIYIYVYSLILVIIGGEMVNLKWWVESI